MGDRALAFQGAVVVMPRSTLTLILIAGVLGIATSLNGARAQNAGGRSGAPVPTGQNPLFSQPLNQPLPPATSTTQRYYPPYPSYSQQPRRPPSKAYSR
jgi:hypothetical protein